MPLSRPEPEEAIGKTILACAMRVHTALGPGLLESTYEVCLAHELAKEGLRAERQVTLPIEYDGVRLDAGYRIDLLIESTVVLEVKSVDKLAEIHTAQLLSYLKLGKFHLEYLLNFNVLHMKEGIRRVVN
ncbi:MAG TPA: GxxExxY protein [Burkholderiales bacterium]|nr:GxxExxY protein [Burkholderiales bacterium]